MVAFSSKQRSGRNLKLAIASAIAAMIAPSATWASQLLFDNLTTSTTKSGTGSTPNTFMGDGYNLLAGAVDITGFDVTPVNFTTSTYTALKGYIYVWQTVNTGTVSATTPAFGTELASYYFTSTGTFSPNFYYTYQSSTPGNGGIGLTTPLTITNSTIGITFNYQVSTDGVNYSSVNSFTSVVGYGTNAASPGSDVFNGYYRNVNSETNGNFTGSLRSLGQTNQSVTVRVYGDISSTTPDLWLNSGGGQWNNTSSNATNWSAGATPGSGSDASFNLSSTSGYTVEVNDSESAKDVLVQNDNVTFDVDGVTSKLTIVGALTVGQPAVSGNSSTGSLTLINSQNNQTNSVLANSIAVGGNGGVGTLTDKLSVLLYSTTDTSVAAGSSLVVAFGGKLGTSTLTIAGTTNAWTGTVDIGSSALDIRAGTIATVMNQLQQGYNNGAWNGKGIISSAAAADSTHLTAVGAILNTDNKGNLIYGSGTTLGMFDGDNPANTAVLVRYTYYGDANLDGTVDGSDYTLIDNGFNNKLTGWYNGDFNYDGKVDGSDYTLIDNTFNTQGSSLGVSNDAVQAGLNAGVTAADEMAFDESLYATVVNGAPIATPVGGSLTASSTTQFATPAVPEPASMSLIVMAAIPLLRRRSRRGASSCITA